MLTSSGIPGTRDISAHNIWQVAEVAAPRPDNGTPAFLSEFFALLSCRPSITQTQHGGQGLAFSHRSWLPFSPELQHHKTNVEHKHLLRHALCCFPAGARQPVALNSGTVFFAELFARPSRRPNSPKNHSNMTWKTRACLLAPITFLFLARTATSQNFSALVHYSVTHSDVEHYTPHSFLRAFTLDW